MDEDYQKRIEDLEGKSLQVQLQPTEKENLKNNLFEVFTNVLTESESTHFKVIWKDKVFFIPTVTAPFALTDSTSIDTDAQDGSMFTLTTTQNFTLNNPTNAYNGKKIIYKIKQDSTGSRVITWGSKFRGTVASGLPTLSTTANYVDYIGFVYDSSVDKWNCWASQLGFAT